MSAASRAWRRGVSETAGGDTAAVEIEGLRDLVEDGLAVGGSWLIRWTARSRRLALKQLLIIGVADHTVLRLYALPCGVAGWAVLVFSWLWTSVPAAPSGMKLGEMRYLHLWRSHTRSR